MTTIPIAKPDDVSGGKALIERLKNASFPDQNGCRLFTADLTLEAAEALTAASERRRVLEEALKPFTTVPLGGNGANERLLIISTKGAYHILESDLMRAHTALHAEPG